MLTRYFPILAWGRSYDRPALTSDLLAAVIVTIMLIPQSLAYAMLAGLPPVVGLYASILPLFAYAVFGTSRTLAVGPVAVVSLMTASAAGAVLFGVADYVPALMEYVGKYGIDLELGSNLVAVDGPARQATFATGEGEETVAFDMLHVVPPQVAPQFLADSALAAASGFTDIDQHTLQHVRFPNVFGLGDGGSTPNAKTAAAARKQAPVVAVNALRQLDGKGPAAGYDGYGSCPLTVERGKIVLAEFAYGGKLAPSFPTWLVDGTRPARLSWMLKADALPWIYWNGMLKGREWLAGPGGLIAQ